VLLAIRFTLRGVRAWLVKAVVQRGCGGVLVVDMAVALFLGRPAFRGKLASLLRALPGTFMCLYMLRQVTWTLELFLTIGFRACVDLWLGILLAPGHRAEHFIVVGINIIGHMTFHGGSGDLLLRKREACGDTYSLAVLVTNKLGLLPVMTHASLE
jgi:hypothetical protein